MPAMWSQSYETGNASIDRQHRELLAIVDELDSGQLPAPASTADVLRVLDRVMDFATTHFVMEENLMAQVGYPSPACEQMVEQHREFTAFVRQRVLEFHDGELVDVGPLHAFLAERLTAHEFGRDRLLADFIRTRAET